MVTDFLKQMVSEIETISDETIYDFGLSLPVVEKEEKIIGVLSEEGKRIYSLLILKGDELEEKNLSLIEKESLPFLTNNPEWKDLCEEIASGRDKINVMRNLLLMEIQLSIQEDYESNIQILLRRDWQIIGVKIITEDSKNYKIDKFSN